jgi:Raf kinase inhibitor-like YbhB/YbcL family protein
MKQTPVVLVVLLVVFYSFSALTGAAQSLPGGTSLNFHISTTAFAVGGEIPKKYTCDGQDFSPALSWSGAPEGTKSFALIVDDPDAPVGTWNHWLIWNIPATSRQLGEAVAKTKEVDGARQGQNDFRKIGYNGPCPPPGKPHRYYFKLFALDGELTLSPGADRKQLDAAIKGHVLAQTELMGRYGR